MQIKINMYAIVPFSTIKLKLTLSEAANAATTKWLMERSIFIWNISLLNRVIWSMAFFLLISMEF